MINELEYRSVENIETITKVKKEDAKPRKELKKYIGHN